MNIWDFHKLLQSSTTCSKDGFAFKCFAIVLLLLIYTLISSKQSLFTEILFKFFSNFLAVILIPMTSLIFRANDSLCTETRKQSAYEKVSNDSSGISMQIGID